MEASNVPVTTLAHAQHHCVEVDRAVQALGLGLQEVSRLLLCLPPKRSAARRRHSQSPHLSLGIGNTLWIGVLTFSAATYLVHSLAQTKDQLGSYRTFFPGLRRNINIRQRLISCHLCWALCPLTFGGGR